MASTASPAAKKANADASKYDIDNVIPVLLAVLDNPSINFKKMAAMDDVGRTEFAWQHRFRKWRTAAKDIAVAHSDALTEFGGTPAKTPSKKAANSGRKNAKKQGTPTPSAEDGDDSGSDEHKSTKKRACTADADNESPTKKKKAASTKKGTAKPTKKVAPVKTEEEAGSENEEEGVEMEFQQAV